MRRGRSLLALAVLVGFAAASAGCGATIAYRKGKADAKNGDWDAAVARFTRAALADPDKVEYKLALEKADGRDGGFQESVRMRLEALGG